jgi:hypothetical protein
LERRLFALGFLGKDADETHPAYLNWDRPGWIITAKAEIRGPAAIAIFACILFRCASSTASLRPPISDTEGYSMELRYLRDTNARGTDFVVLRDGKPLFAVECKAGEKAIRQP